MKLLFIICNLKTIKKVIKSKLQLAITIPVKIFRGNFILLYKKIVNFLKFF
jgi:hypothetical protein